VTAEHRARAALRAFSADLLRYFERRVPSQEDAADLLSETMLQVWRRYEACPSEAEDQRRWLYQVAANVLSNHRRASRRRSALVTKLRSVIQTDTEADATESVAVRELVESLPADQRELIRLVHWDGLSLADAAAVLGINASTARSRYAAARGKLRQVLYEHAD